ncbi:MAG TPA: acyl-ACP--UDP-N-acetylglucosamine O-acyltransferase [Burkholderiaceae bacterium]
MANIHPTAIVDKGAQLDDSVEIGPYSVIGPHVVVGAGTKIGPHVVVEGHTTIGRDNTIYQFTSVGSQPQDKKFAGEITRLEIGDRNLIREFCSLNTGTAQDAGVTRLGNDNWILAYCHIAHDCQVGNNTIFSNNATLAGHVHVGDWVVMGGFAAIPQFRRIGAHAFIGMTTSVTQDVPPFVLVQGNPAQPYGINVEGLKRRGFSAEQIASLRRAYKQIYRSDLTLEQAVAALGDEAQKTPEAAEHLATLQRFLSTATRGIVR